MADLGEGPWVPTLFSGQTKACRAKKKNCFQEQDPQLPLSLGLPLTHEGEVANYLI